MLFKRSLLQELISNAAGSFLVLLGVVVAQRVGYLIKLAAKGLLPNDAIMTMLGFNIIKFLPMLLSLTLFLSILMTLSRWYRDSEMVVWFSSGLSLNSLLRPVMSFAIPLIVLIFILSLVVMPWATSKGEDFWAQLESRDEMAAISPGVFKESANFERVFFIESFDALGNVVKNIFVQSTQQQKEGIIVASRGNRYVTKNGDSFLLLQNGTRYQGIKGTAEFSTTNFEKYAIRLKTVEVIKPPERTISKSTQELFSNKSNINSAELQWRFAIPILSIVLTLFAIPLSAVDPRAGRSINFAFALLIYVIYNNLLSVMQNWVAQGKVLSLIGLWPVHIVFVLIAVYMFYRSQKQMSLYPKILIKSGLKVKSILLSAKVLAKIPTKKV